MRGARASSRSKTLRIGFGVVLGVLVASTATAWRIQESLSQRSVEIHRKYLKEQERLTRLRGSLWLGSLAARDLFLNPYQERTERYFQQVKALKNETESIFIELAALGIPERTTRRIREKYDDFWQALDRLRYTHGNVEPELQYDLLQTEIVPRRDAALDLLKSLEAATDASFYDSETAFASSRRRAAIALFVLLGVGLMLAAGVASYSVRYSERLEAQTERQLGEVSQAKMELERLSARLMEIQEQERTRLARELHDEIVQNLAVTRIEITQAETLLESRAADRAERLKRAREITDRTMKTVRNIMTLLRPSMLDDLGLGPALQWLTEDFQRRTGVTCAYSEQGIEENLPDAVKTCVYRVIQEALHNCQKHAQATAVSVRAVRGGTGLTAQVVDNGRGFNAPAASVHAAAGHFGLLGMRERAQALGGAVTIESTHGKGTVVTLKLPIRKGIDMTPQTVVTVEANA